MFNQCSVLSNEAVQISGHVDVRQLTQGPLDLQSTVIGQSEFRANFHVEFVFEITLFGNDQAFDVEVGFVNGVQRVFVGSNCSRLCIKTRLAGPNRQCLLS